VATDERISGDRAGGERRDGHGPLYHAWLIPYCGITIEPRQAYLVESKELMADGVWCSEMLSTED
jgi:hypothetical protein